MVVQMLAKYLLNALAMFSLLVQIGTNYGNSLFDITEKYIVIAKYLNKK